MKTWVKLYTEILDDPEFSSKLTLEHCGVWGLLLALAGKLDKRDQDGNETGELDTLENIAWYLRCEVDTLKRTVPELVEIGLLTNRFGILRIVDWREKYISITRNLTEWRSIRQQVLERDQGICQYCGDPADQVDHVIPWSKGGSEDMSNLVACCAACNLRKLDRTPEEAGMVLRASRDME